MSKIDQVYEILLELEKTNVDGVSAMDMTEVIDLGRSTISRYLNTLYKENKLLKIDGRPVLYKTIQNKKIPPTKKKIGPIGLDKMTGAKQSLNISIEKAKAAIMYPPKGLHTLLLGETGVGKSLFAEQMYEYAKEIEILDEHAPFIRFNCADYVDNPALLTAQIFGVKKGTYTGADENRVGLLKEADNGILFLDEIHRLPPQGQEMLFTYIDKGFYRPLGETEKLVYVNVRIIAATTEDPKSYLLQTFSRRIPMTILLPSLSERPLNERYSLIEAFIKEESHRVGKSIYINKNSIISYLLYDCPNNIGQLKSDIQLACAKAFLNYKANETSYLLINQGDLPNHVRKGMLYINDYRKEVDELLLSTHDVLRFSEDESPLQLTHEEENISEDFYNIIEEKIESLKKVGMEEQDINEILNIDIESHFQKYIGEISQRFRKDDLNNVVDIEIINVVEEILVLANKTFQREFDEKIYFGLTFHLERSVDRIRKGEKIYNPKLNFIRINYEKEFIFAMQIAKIIDSRFSIETPVDEIGYLSMFFASDSFSITEEMKPKVRVLVVMHGRSTASSMVEVVNSLVGTEDIIPLDMPLSMKPQIMYELTKQKVQEIYNGKGIIMLVDMGSLTNFGDMIKEETGIDVRTIDMVSTLTVLDVARKSIMNYSLDEIANSINKNKPYDKKEINKRYDNKNIIITACFTGEGSSIKIAELIKKKINRNDISVMPMNIIDEKSFEERIWDIKDDYNILAIISTIDIKVRGIPYIPAIEIFNKNGEERLINILEEEEMYYNVADSLEEHLLNIKGGEIVKEVKNLIVELEFGLDVTITKDVKMGIILHICFLIDNVLDGRKTREFDGLNMFAKQYDSEMLRVKAILKELEDKYRIEIGNNEIAHIVKLLIENNITV